jgi:DNA mismatch repair ATPase MutL
MANDFTSKRRLPLLNYIYQFLQFRNLSITTCHKSQNIGARIEYNHDGHITKQEATARPHGTTVTLQNLFSTLPVRHKEFLRNIKREYTKMMQVLQGYCVISTGVRISCHTIGEKGKKSLALATNSNHDMRENISNVFGPKQVGFHSTSFTLPWLPEVMQSLLGNLSSLYKAPFHGILLFF